MNKRVPTNECDIKQFARTLETLIRLQEDLRIQIMHLEQRETAREKAAADAERQLLGEYYTRKLRQIGGRLAQVEVTIDSPYLCTVKNYKNSVGDLVPINRLPIGTLETVVINNERGHVIDWSLFEPERNH